MSRKRKLQTDASWVAILLLAGISGETAVFAVAVVGLFLTIVLSDLGEK